jgi:hypothetical protein
MSYPVSEGQSLKHSYNPTSITVDQVSLKKMSKTYLLFNGELDINERDALLSVKDKQKFRLY